MRTERKIIFLSVLIAAIFLLPSALASTNQAAYPNNVNQKNNDDITIDFIDYTGRTPIKKEITLSRVEWNEITKELRSFTASQTTLRGAFDAQLSVLKNHGLVSREKTIDSLLSHFNKKTKTELFHTLRERSLQNLPINNSIFSALSAITFTMENKNGSTIVFGLNTFINYIGFNIISAHKGYATDGIKINGLITKSVPPGQYAGLIFGFFGYWFGEKISTGVYSNLTVAGLGIITFWMPVP